MLFKILNLFLNIFGRSILIFHAVALIKWILFLPNCSTTDHIYVSLVFCVFIIHDMIKSLFVPKLESKWYSRTIVYFILTEVPLMWILEIEKHRLKLDAKREQISVYAHAIKLNQTIVNYDEKITIYSKAIYSINLWSQSFYIMIIIARLLIPKRHCSLEQMSNLGLLLLGTASDLQEFQAQIDEIYDKNNTDHRIKFILILVFIIWTWSISLLAINLDRSDSKSSSRFFDSLIQNFYWKITINLFLNDVPYLLIRLFLFFYFQSEEGSDDEGIFFMVKNFIGIAVGVSRFLSTTTASKNNLSRKVE
jgi:hypothetical protein